MRDCANVEVRDALPELVHDRLPAAERERVLAHVASCADCTDEVALLRGARRVIDRAAPTVDAAAIARAVQARLAADAAQGRTPTTPVRPIPTAATLQPAWSATRAARAPRSRWASRSSVRAIAAALVMAIGFGGAMLARDDRRAVSGAVGAGATPARSSEAAPVQVAPAPSGAVAAAPGRAGASSAPESSAGVAGVGAPTLALGETFADLSEDELAAVIDAINEDDARLPAAEPASYETLPLGSASAPEGGLP